MVMAVKSKKLASNRSIRLTTRQEIAAILYAKGKTMVEAYVQAFSKERLSHKSAMEGASRLFKRPAIAARVKELQHKSEAKALLSINDRLRLLAENAQMPVKTSGDRSAQARVIEVYTKIAGGFEPERRELTGANGTPLAITATLSLPSTAPLMARLEALAAEKLSRDAPH